MREIEIHDYARQLLEAHGAKAIAEAAQNAIALEVKGDLELARTWRHIEDALKLRDVQIYLWFARFPVWRIEHREGNETAVEVSDVRFFRQGDPIEALDPPQSKSFAAPRPRRTGCR